VPDIRRFETEFLDFIGREHKSIFEVIASTGALGPDTLDQLTAATLEFKKQFVATDGASVVVADELPTEPSGDLVQEQETVTISRPKPPPPAETG
jgi:F-type H+/Na+-transporting ATPase subunit alpha